ncbi:MAG: hypothetical protein CL626_03545, partial [Aurantimonas sp.]|nr:hypothetical protein [Aurantimonas sp.]
MTQLGGRRPLWRGRGLLSCRSAVRATAPGYPFRATITPAAHPLRIPYQRLPSIRNAHPTHGVILGLDPRTHAVPGDSAQISDGMVAKAQ